MTEHQIHLYWGARFSSERAKRILAETFLGIALCGARVSAERLTLSPASTTCPLCRKTWDREHKEKDPTS